MRHTAVHSLRRHCALRISNNESTMETRPLRIAGVTMTRMATLLTILI